MSARRIENLIQQLRNMPAASRGRAFNPWWEVDPKHDASPAAPQIRRENLKSYLSARLKSARICLVGEALGYRGGHFSGIAMTSERILLGGFESFNIRPEQVVPVNPRRTSKPELFPDGFSEPTATIVWKQMTSLEILPNEFVIWNIFAWHPFEPRKGMLSNRRPSDKEFQDGLAVFDSFRKLFPDVRYFAVGKMAEAGLGQYCVDCTPLRHPAQGGSVIFRRQLAENLAVKTG